MLVHPALVEARFLEPFTARRDALSSAALATLTSVLAVQPHLWRPVVRHDPEQRWYERLLRTEAVEVWLIGWAPGQSTPLHDHTGAAGALVVADGALTETTYAPPLLGRATETVHRAGTVLSFSAAHVHRVANDTNRLATSIHAYSPPDRPLRELDDIPVWPEAVPPPLVAAAPAAGARR